VFTGCWILDAVCEVAMQIDDSGSVHPMRIASANRLLRSNTRPSHDRCEQIWCTKEQTVACEKNRIGLPVVSLFEYETEGVVRFLLPTSDECRSTFKISSFFRSINSTALRHRVGHDDGHVEPFIGSIGVDFSSLGGDEKRN